MTYDDNSQAINIANVMKYFLDQVRPSPHHASHPLTQTNRASKRSGCVSRTK